jgi:hypothetical protein
MTLQLRQNESTWPRPRVLPVTNCEVTTPISKRPAVVSGAMYAEFSSIEDVETLLYQNHDTPTFRAVVPEINVPGISSIKSVHEGALATVIQIWEGTVISVDNESAVMTVKLTDRGGLIGEHTADIDLQWVAEQDRDLLRAGAVFYWTLFKETKRGSVSNSQEIRFRRLPSWNKTQLAIMQQEARELSAKFSMTTRIAD